MLVVESLGLLTQRKQASGLAINDERTLERIAKSNYTVSLLGQSEAPSLIEAYHAHQIISSK